MAVLLTLGGVVFNDFEVPEAINSGGEQMLVIHKLPGGSRVIDAMGPDDDDIRWTGRFRGSGAEQRALLLDSMRRSGQQVLLTYSLHRYQVIIREFKADFQQAFEIPYTIACTILLDETQGLATTAIGFIESLVSDVASAVGLGDVIGSDTINSAVTGVVTAVSNYQAGVPNTTNALAGVTALAEGPLLAGVRSSIATAQSATQSGITTANASVVASPVPGGGAPTGLASALSSTASAFGQLANLQQLSSVLGRMSINTQNAGN